MRGDWTLMRRAFILLGSAFFGLMTGCVSPRLNKTTHWDQVPEAAAAEMKTGRFHAPLARMFDVTQTTLEREGMVVDRRDLVNVLLQTMPWTEPGQAEPNVLKAVLKADGKDYTQITWKHYKLIRYRLVNQGGVAVPETPQEKESRRGRESRGDYTEAVEHFSSEDEAYKAKVNEDLNWRVYQVLAGRIIPQK